MERERLTKIVKKYIDIDALLHLKELKTLDEFINILIRYKTELPEIDADSLELIDSRCMKELKLMNNFAQELVNELNFENKKMLIDYRIEKNRASLRYILLKRRRQFHLYKDKIIRDNRKQYYKETKRAEEYKLAHDDTDEESLNVHGFFNAQSKQSLSVELIDHLERLHKRLERLEKFY